MNPAVDPSAMISRLECQHKALLESGLLESNIDDAGDPSLGYGNFQ